MLLQNYPILLQRLLRKLWNHFCKHPPSPRLCYSGQDLEKKKKSPACWQKKKTREQCTACSKLNRHFGYELAQYPFCKLGQLLISKSTFSNHPV